MQKQLSKAARYADVYSFAFASFILTSRRLRDILADGHLEMRPAQAPNPLAVSYAAFLDKTTFRQMTWQQIKDKIYYEDGSLRDILICNTTKDDWKKWVDFVNSNYKVSTRSYETDQVNDTIDFSQISDYWNGKTDNCSMTSVLLDKIIINAYYFDQTEIENDITPKEIKSSDDHNKLMKYLLDISNLLNKKVILTPENDREIILISADKGKVDIGIN